MRKFDYRSPRFPVDLPVRLTWGDLTRFGRCREISTEGMKLELNESFCPTTVGALDLCYEDVNLRLPVRLTHSGPNFDAVKFVYESIEQKDAVARLVACLTGPKPCTSLALRF
jgi:hypothetical protein